MEVAMPFSDQASNELCNFVIGTLEFAGTLSES